MPTSRFSLTLTTCPADKITGKGIFNSLSHALKGASVPEVNTMLNGNYYIIFYMLIDGSKHARLTTQFFY